MFPRLELNHLELKVPSTFLVWPLPVVMTCGEPLTCSGSSAPRNWSSRPNPADRRCTSKG